MREMFAYAIPEYCRSYPREGLPDGVTDVTVAVLPLLIGTLCEVRGWNRETQESWGIERFTLKAQITDAGVQYHLQQCGALPLARMIAIEYSGYLMDDVLPLESAPKITLFRCRSGADLPLLGKPMLVAGHPVYPVTRHAALDLIANRLRLEQTLPKSLHWPAQDGVPDSSRGYDDRYFTEMAVERRERVPQSDPPAWQWKPRAIFQFSYALDLLVLGLAGFTLLTSGQGS